MLIQSHCIITFDMFIKNIYLCETSKYFRKYKKKQASIYTLFILNNYTNHTTADYSENNIDEKISNTIEMLYERKKDIIESRRNIISWSGIILSLFLGLTGIFLSKCSNTKLDETQIQEIKQSIEKSKTIYIGKTKDIIKNKSAQKSI